MLKISPLPSVYGRGYYRNWLPIEIISTGLPDIIIPVQAGQLDILHPDHDAIANLSREFGTIGFHVFELSHHAPSRPTAEILPLYMA
ncbi:hypothetical protein [Providencia stuartii]|uniref:hypothetical protein n=1 Tax=Providencia stuartii TaxID=588 RepID=UPI001D10202F|nr:hypothetical protein [Providencia stuartii]